MYILFFRYLNVILIHVSWDGWSLHDIIYTSCQLLISYCVGKKAIKSKPTWSPQYLISILLVVWYQIILELNCSVCLWYITNTLNMKNRSSTDISYQNRKMNWFLMPNQSYTNKKWKVFLVPLYPCVFLTYYCLLKNSAPLLLDKW